MSKTLNLKNTITENNCSFAHYSGEVTIAVFHKDKLLKRITSHNAGLEPLFTFISKCLAGRWSEAQESRPCKLILLEAGAGEDTTTSTPLNDPADKGYWTSRYAISTPMIYDNAVLNTTTSSPASGSVTYHFRIPSLALAPGKIIKKLVLLPTLYNESSYKKDACAYFILPSGEEIQVPDQSGNTTVIIDWTLKFTNANEGEE